MDIDLSQFRDSFLAECTEHIAQIEEGLLELEAGRAAKDRLDAIFRAAHSVKGAAGTFGWTAIVRLTHAMEDLLDRMRSGRLDVSPRLVHALLSGVDEVKLTMANRDASEGFAETMTASSTAILKEMRLLLEGAVLIQRSLQLLRSPNTNTTSVSFLQRAVSKRESIPS